MRRTFAALAVLSATLLLAACCGTRCCDDPCGANAPCGVPAYCVSWIASSGSGAAVYSPPLVGPQRTGPDLTNLGNRLPKWSESTAVVAAPASPINTTCPVLLGNPVDPSITTVYQGRVVGFCCAMCKAKFEKDPERYAKNLP